MNAHAHGKRNCVKISPPGTPAETVQLVRKKVGPLAPPCAKGPENTLSNSPQSSAKQARNWAIVAATIASGWFTLQMPGNARETRLHNTLPANAARATEVAHAESLCVAAISVSSECGLVWWLLRGPTTKECTLFAMASSVGEVFCGVGVKHIALVSLPALRQ